MYACLKNSCAARNSPLHNLILAQINDATQVNLMRTNLRGHFKCWFSVELSLKAVVRPAVEVCFHSHIEKDPRHHKRTCWTLSWAEMCSTISIEPLPAGECSCFHAKAIFHEWPYSNKFAAAVSKLIQESAARTELGSKLWKNTVHLWFSVPPRPWMDFMDRWAILAMRKTKWWVCFCPSVSRQDNTSTC